MSFKILQYIHNTVSIIHFKRQCSTNTSCLSYYQKVFQTTDAAAKLFFMKRPNLSKKGLLHLQCVVQTIESLNLPVSELSQHPSLMSQLPLTIVYRMKVLSECAFTKVSVSSLSNYLSLVKRRSIEDLMTSGFIDKNTNVRDKLCMYFDNHSILLMRLSQLPYLNCTLDDLRHIILREYLTIIFQISKDEYDKMLDKYVTIRHRPLQIINEILYLILNDLFISKKKVKNNLYVLCTNPDNVRLVLNELKSLAGVDIREILKKRLKLLATSYKNFIEIQTILNKFGISLPAQRRCFEIYTLSPATVYERLVAARHTEEFKVFLNNPRFLRLIYHNKKANNRLDSSKKSHKSYPSLDILTRSGSEEFDTYLNTPDETHGNMDVINTLKQILGSNFESKNISVNLRMHKFWKNVPINKVIFVLENLQKHFKVAEIRENIQILLYPWDKVEPCVNFFIQSKAKQSPPSHCSEEDNYKNGLILLVHDVDLSRLSDSHILSLVLYCLEKDHYFSGNGIWSNAKLSENNKSCKTEDFSRDDR